MNLFKKYVSDGFIVLKDVVPKEYIAELRQVGFEVLGEKRRQGQLSIFNKTFIQNGKLICLPFLDKVVSAIRKVLGDNYLTISQYSMNANALSPVWHTDSQSHLNAEYLFNRNYLISKCGLYLQEHDSVYGGGLEIIPYSHRPTFLGCRSFIGRDKKLGRVSSLQWQSIKYRNKYVLKRIVPKLDLGDVLLFHGMLVHRASQPDFSRVESSEKYGIRDVPKDKYKFMIQWEVSPDNEFVPVYLAHQKMRGINESGLFREALSVRYPDDYPDQAMELIKNNECRIVGYNEAPDYLINSKMRYSQDGTPINLLYNK